jgi:hypothetical protein
LSLLVPLTWVSGLGLSRVSASAGAWTGFATQGSNSAWRSFRSLDWRDRDDHWGQTFDAATYPQSVALARLLVSPRWRERILDKSWPWHDEFVAELCRSVAADYVWDSYPRIRLRRDHDDPLREWRQHVRRLEFEPPAPDHPANMPETIEDQGHQQRRTNKRIRRVESGQCDEPVAEPSHRRLTLPGLGAQGRH